MRGTNRAGATGPAPCGGEDDLLAVPPFIVLKILAYSLVYESRRRSEDKTLVCVFLQDRMILLDLHGGGKNVLTLDHRPR